MAATTGARRKKDSKRGSKVHAAVDTLPARLTSHPVAEQDRAQEEALLAESVQEVTEESVQLAYVDQGYTSEEASADAETKGIRLEAIKHPGVKKGFVLLPRW